MWSVSDVRQTGELANETALLAFLAVNTVREPNYFDRGLSALVRVPCLVDKLDQRVSSNKAVYRVGQNIAVLKVSLAGLNNI